MKKPAIAVALLSLAVCGFGAEVPRKAPELTIPLPAGGQVKLSDYRGKVVILAFILTT
ncbi:MAG: peroxiredoxin family protein [Bryobacteraceae bacterium]